MKIYTIFIATITFFISACSHTPVKTIHSSDQDTSKLNLVETYQEPDIIVPLLDRSLQKSIVKNTKTNRLIWEHIENGLGLTEFYDHPRVALQKQKYLNNSEYLSIVTKRSEPFIHFVLTEIEKRQMPTELAILPIVESGYYPRARSRASAEGLWQIMPYTGKELGLKRTYSYDGRHDVYASTSAALDYLEQMLHRFDGDWLLAFAAYNAGPQRIKRALKSIQTPINENVFWKLRLPRETREYIPKILALASIVENKQHSSNLLHPIIDEPYLTTIQLSKQISPAKLIREAKVSESEIKLLNPALRNLNLPIHAGYQLLVPKHDVGMLTAAISRIPEETQPVLAKHKINRGESLSGIARRYGTNVYALREANNLRNNKIVAGNTLIVPTGENKHPVTFTQKKHKKINAKAAKLPAKQTISEPFMYVVAMGDSFWKIANRNNTTVQRLFEINGRSADQPLQPGESILVD